MSLLSDKAMHDLWVTHGVSFDTIRAIEAAVLEAQGKQKPVAEVVKATGSLKDIHIIRWMNEYEAKEGDKLFAAPVVQPAPEEGSCSTHPDAPHGFDRNASHNAGRYVCECEGWTYGTTVTNIKEAYKAEQKAAPVALAKMISAAEGKE